MFLSWDQKMPGIFSLTGTCLKLVTAIMCVYGVTSQPLPPDLKSTYNTSNIFTHWLLHRAGLRVKTIFEPAYTNLTVTSPSEIDLLTSGRSTSPAMTPNKTFSIPEVSLDVLSKQVETSTQSEEIVPNVVDDVKDRTPITSTKVRESMLLDSGATAYEHKLNTTKVVSDGTLLPVQVPETSQDTAIVPNSQSVIQQKQGTNSSSNAILSTPTSLNTGSQSLPNVNGIPFNSGSLEDLPAMMPEHIAEDSSDLDSKPAGKSKVASTEEETVTSDRDGTHRKTTFPNQDVPDGQSVIAFSSFENQNDKVEVSGTHAGRRPLNAPPTVTKEVGLLDYSSGEETETPKEDPNPVSSEDSSEPVIILSTDERGNAFGMATTVKSDNPDLSTKQTFHATTPTSPDGESKDDNRLATRKRGGRKRNRKKSTPTTSIPNFPTTFKSVTRVPSFVNDGHTLKWPVGTPIPEWEEKSRRTRDADKNPGSSVTKADRSGEKGNGPERYADEEETTDKDETTPESETTEEATTPTIPTITTTPIPTQPPAVVTSMELTNITHNSVTVTGEIDNWGNSDVVLRIESESNVLHEKTVTAKDDGNFHEVFKDLGSCIEYTVTASPASDPEVTPKSFRTYLGISPAVRDLKAQRAEPGNTDLNVTWNEPDTPCANNISFYRVSWYKSKDAATELSGFKRIDVPMTSHLMESLDYNKNYVINVVPFTKLINGTELEGNVNSITALTRMNYPSKPQGLKLASCSRSFNVSWSPPNTTYDTEISGYKYCWREVERNFIDCKRESKNSDDKYEYIVPILKGRTKYTVSVSAYSMDNGIELFSKENATGGDTTLREAEVSQSINTLFSSAHTVNVTLHGYTDGPASSVNYRFEEIFGNAPVENEEYSFTLTNLTTCTKYSGYIFPITWCQPFDLSHMKTKAEFTTPLGATEVVNLKAIAKPAGSRTVEVTWDPPDKCEDEIKQYIIRWYKTEEGENTKNTIDNPPGNYNRTLELDYFTNYTIQVQVVTETKTETVQTITGDVVTASVTTRMASPLQPLDLILDPPCSRSINASWSPPHPSNKTVISGFEYCWKKTSEINLNDCLNVTKTSFDKYEVVVPNLQPDTKYTVSVRTYSMDNDTVLWSEEAATLDKMTLPDAYITLSSMPFIFSSSETVNVTISGSAVGLASSVDYSLSLDNTEHANTLLDDEKFTIELKQLATCTEYNVTIWPISSCPMFGSSPLTLTKNFKTPLGAVEVASLNPFANTSGSSIVEVTWEPPETKTCSEEIVRYIVGWYKTKEGQGAMETRSTLRGEHNLTLELDYFQNYTIQVEVVTQKDGSTEVTGDRVTKEVTTRMETPPSPTISSDSSCSHYVTFSFESRPWFETGKIDYFEYCYAQPCNPEATWNRTDQYNVTIHDLQPSASYDISLRAVSLDQEFPLYSKLTEFSIKTLHNVNVTNVDVTVTSSTADLKVATIGPVGSVYWLLKSDDPASQEVSGSGPKNVEINIPELKICSSYDVYLWVASSCSSENSSATAHKTNFTTLSPPPPEVIDLQTSNHGSTSAQVTWLKPEPYGCAISNYSIIYKPLNNSYEDENPGLLYTSTTSFDLTDLHPYTSYSIEVKGITNGGDGTPESTTFVTEIGTPFKPEVDELGNCSSKECNVTWSMPASENGPRQFSITCNRTDGTEFTEFIEPLVLPNNDEQDKLKQFLSTISDLLAFEDYFCRVNVSIGPFENISDTAYLRTKPDAPVQPTAFQVHCNVDFKQGEASWNMVPRSNGILQKFTINYSGSREDDPEFDCSRKKDFEAKEGEEKYSGKLELEAECNYEFKIVAYNQDVDQPSEESKGPSCFQKALEPAQPKEEEIKIEKKKDTGIISFNKNLFSEENGIIRNYSMIMYAGTKRGSLRNTELKHWKDVYYLDEIQPYVVTPPNWNPFASDGKRSQYRESDDNRENDKCCTAKGTSVDCILGCDTTCADDLEKNNPCNGPLHPDTTYYVVIRATTNGGYTDTNPVEFTTGDESKSAVNATLGVSLALLALIVAGGIFVHYRRNDFKNLFFLKRSAESGTQTSTLTISNRTLTRPEHVTEFQRYYDSMAADSGLKFSEEYEELKKASQTHPTTVAEQLENRSKNRWVNILPFDQSRVKLSSISDDVTTDYINACYIPGVNSLREYIATQGPLPGTNDDFWRMIWEQKSQMIVMVTQLIERGKVKCEQYWPSDRDVHYYGDLAIQLRSESILPGFTLRIFDLNMAPTILASPPEGDTSDSVQLLANNVEQGTKSLEVKQMHFTNWPDFGCPENTSLLINFVEEVRAHMPHEFWGPIVVHCSAGVGRTGTYIAVDRILQHLKTEDYVDIYGIVLDMRNYRTNMVQTEDQYVYIHQCIRDVLASTQEITVDGDAIYQNFSAVTKNRDSQL